MNNITVNIFKIQMICRRQKINTSQITLIHFYCTMQIKIHVPKIVDSLTDAEIWYCYACMI
jgi:hypothetical protein